MNGDPSNDGMGEIVQTVARWLRGLILVYGIFVVLYGHLSPGGGFEGGVVIASCFILLTLAGGEQQGQRFLSRRIALAFASAGLLIFLVLALIGMGRTNGAFLQNVIGTSDQAWFTLFSGGVIPLLNVGIGLLVASLLFLVFTSLATVETGAEKENAEGDDS
jgi:multicomponent Na+:H+ antiporter subunit B